MKRQLRHLPSAVLAQGFGGSVATVDQNVHKRVEQRTASSAYIGTQFDISEVTAYLKDRSAA